MPRELSIEECEALLARHRVGRIAVRDVEGAYIVPMSFVFEGGVVHAHTSPGHKLQLLRRWPHVAFQADEVEEADRWRSVLVRGRFRELTDPDEQAHTRLVLVRAFGGNPVAVTAPHGHRTTLADAIVFRIEPETVTGRAEGM